MYTLLTNTTTNAANPVPATKKAWKSVVGTAEVTIPQQACSNKEQIVEIEIHYSDDARKPYRQHNEQKTRVPRNEVHPEALELAKELYKNHRAELTSCDTREKFLNFYSSLKTSSTINAGVVLFALAKGMFVVNVFNQGASLGWHAPPTPKRETTTRFTRRESEVKQVVDADGFISTVRKTVTKHQNNTPTMCEAPKPVMAQVVVVPTEEQKREKINASINERIDIGTYLDKFYRIHSDAMNELLDNPEKSESYNEILQFHKFIVEKLDSRFKSLEAEIDELRQSKERLN